MTVVCRWFWHGYGTRGPSAWEVCVAGHPPPADWLTCGSADTLPVRDRGCPLRLLSSGTQRARDLQIRRSGQVVQDRPLRSVRWADIPELSARDRRCPAAWQQYWQQSRRNGADPRPSAFQAGHMPSWHGSCERYALSSVAAGCRWSLLLLSPLLSIRLRGLSMSVVCDRAWAWMLS